jgi:type IV pilus assembly protein PilX
MSMSGFNRARQHGVALFISLVLLLVLTIIGVSSVQTTSLEVRMARNSVDVDLAFQAAESALRDAELQIEGIADPSVFTPGGNNGLYETPAPGNPNIWDDPNVWAGASSVEAAVLDGVPGRPRSRYIIEHVASVIREENAYQRDDPYAASAADRVEVFRITALGMGATPNARVLLQSTYGRIMD